MSPKVWVGHCGRHAVGVVLVVGLGVACPAGATFHTLEDGNAQLFLNTSAGPGGQATGYDWIVDGVDHLNELSNWYRVGASGPESSLHPLFDSEVVSDSTPGDGKNDTLTVTYKSGGVFTITAAFRVTGGAPGSGFSAIDEDITITNDSASALSFHFFEYLDLDLDESPTNDTIDIIGPNTMYQHDPNTDSYWQFDADRYEMDDIGPLPDTLGKLTDGGPSNLNSLSPPTTPYPSMGPANMSWALQWDFVGSTPPRTVIPPGVTVFIHKEGYLQMLVPEPATAGLLTLGALGFARVRRRGG